jgi:hypothetical protein
MIAIDCILLIPHLYGFFHAVVILNNVDMVTGIQGSLRYLLPVRPSLYPGVEFLGPMVI